MELSNDLWIILKNLNCIDGMLFVDDVMLIEGKNALDLYINNMELSGDNYSQSISNVVVLKVNSVFGINSSGNVIINDLTNKLVNYHPDDGTTEAVRDEL